MSRTSPSPSTQDLEVWKKAIEIGNKLFDIADELQLKRLHRFAGQARGAGLLFLSVRCVLCLPREIPKDGEAHFNGARDEVPAYL